MKQTNPSSALRITMRLGILGLNEDFVQLNEIMGLKNISKIYLNFILNRCKISFKLLSLSFIQYNKPD